MADEIIENQSLPPASQGEATIAPNLDSELDAALDAEFQGQIKQKPNEQVIEKVETKAEVKEPVQEIKESEKSSKALEYDKTPLPEPEEIDGKFSSKKGDSKEVGWSALRNNYKKAFRLSQKLEQENQKLKEGLAEKGNLTQKETEALKAQIEDLSRYRAMVDIQADPDFISKYDQPIDKNISSIKEMLLSLEVSKDIVNQIDFTNTKLMDDIIGYVGEHKDKFVARKLQRKVEELVDLSDKRNESLEDQKKNYKDLLENKKKETFSRSAEEEGRLYKHLESIAAAKDKTGNNIFPFLNKSEPKQGATQAEIDQANQHNRMVELMGQKIQQVIKMSTPEQKAEVAVAAVASHYLTAQLKAAMTKVQSLEAELQKISAVNSETEKVNSPVRRNGSDKEMDLDEAMAVHFSGAHK